MCASSVTFKHVKIHYQILIKCKINAEDNRMKVNYLGEYSFHI